MKDDGVMQLLTIVEDYVWSLAQQATAEQLEDGSIAAIVLEAPGVVASGADFHECSLDLLRRLEDWVRVGLGKEWRFPIVNGIDLNANQAHILASWYASGANPLRGEFYADRDALRVAFEKHSHSE